MRKTLVIGLLALGLLQAAPAPSAADAIVEKYLLVSRAQQGRLQGATMPVDIAADLPGLKKHGRLRALRKISRIGRITYDRLRFEGDRTVRTDVIARFLAAESESRDSSQLAITPANYKFRYKGQIGIAGRRAYVLQLSPRKKRVGLFAGELWLDAESYLPLRESGRFVKSPSIFLKRVEFVRDYEHRDGMAVLKHLESSVQTRIVGKAVLSVDYGALAFDDATEPATESGEAQ